METERENRDPGSEGIAPDVIGIAVQENCTSRCWFAHLEPCRCPCGGRNHGAMQPGSIKLSGPGECGQLQTIMSITGAEPVETDAIGPEDADPEDADLKNPEWEQAEPPPVETERTNRDAAKGPRPGWRPRLDELSRTVIELAHREDAHGGRAEAGPLDWDQNAQSFMLVLRTYLEKEYRAPDGLQEQLDLETVRAAQEIVGRMDPEQRRSLGPIFRTGSWREGENRTAEA